MKPNPIESQLSSMETKPTDGSAGGPRCALQHLLTAPPNWPFEHAFAWFDQLLLAVTGILTCAVAEDARIPPGMGHRLAQALAQPTSGGLKDLAAFLAKARINHPCVGDLAGWVVDQSPDNGWVGQFVVLRNRMMHDPNGVANQKTIVSHLQEFPDIPGELYADPMGWPGYKHFGKSISLFPVCECRDGRFIWWNRVQENGQATLSDGLLPGAVTAFTEFWRQIRYRDPELVDCSPLDFRAKGSALAPLWPVSDQKWWAADELFKPSLPPHFLVEPDVLGTNLTHVSCRIDFHADKLLEAGPGIAFAKRLGLKQPLMVADLVRLSTSLPGRTLVAIDASMLTARGFLQMIYWLADLAALRDAKAAGQLCVCVSRSREQLIQDHEAIFARLPLGLERAIRPRPHAKHLRLEDFLWAYTPPAHPLLRFPM